MANEVIERENTALQAMTGGGSRLPASVEIEARRAMMEVLSQVQAARLMPRSEMMVQVERELMALAQVPEFAERAIYAKPIGGGEFVEGPSTYLAKQMASKYPNFQWQTIEHGIVDNQDQVECVTWDVEMNNRSKAVVRVSHMRWNAKDRSAYEEKNPSKIHDMVRSETSKTIRNLIFDNMPKLLVSRVQEACEATNDKSAVKLLENRKSMMEYFVKTLEVSEGQILKFVKRDKLADITSRDVRRLRALVQSFKQGEVKPSDVWEKAKDIPVKEESKTADTPSESIPQKEKIEPSSKKSSSKSFKDSAASSDGGAQLAETQAEPSSTLKTEQSISSQSTSSPSSETLSSNTTEETSEPAEQFKPSPKAVSAEEAAALEEMFK